MSDSTDDEWLLVDVDGTPIEPAAEGSLLMAEGLLEIAEQSGDDFIVVEPYTPDFDVVEAQAKSMAFFESVARSEAEAMDTNEEDTLAELEGSELLCEEGYDDEEGLMGSRDLTDPVDWKLEAILKRRLNKEKEGGLWMYLCKWAGYEEATWETREVMEDAGWIPQLNAFDDRGKCGNTPGNASTSASTNQAAHEPRRPKESVLARQHRNAAQLQGYFGSAEQIAARLAAATEHPVMRYCTMNPKLASPFFQRWCGRKRSHVPTLLFHATRAENFESIYNSGLLVGGTKNVPVANGRAFGAGVYTSTGFKSVHYHCYGCNAVLVCIGLVPVDCDAENSTVLKVNDFVVFREEADVYPMWLIQVGGYMVSDFQKVELSEFTSLALCSFSYNPQSFYERESPDGPVYVAPPLKEKLYGKAMASLYDRGHGHISKAALKGQPRKVKKLLAAEERRK